MIPSILIVIFGGVFLVVWLMVARDFFSVQEDRRRDIELIDRALYGRKFPTDPEDVNAYLAAKYGTAHLSKGRRR